MGGWGEREKKTFKSSSVPPGSTITPPAQPTAQHRVDRLIDDGERIAVAQVAPLGQPTGQLALSAHDLAALAAQVAGLVVRARLAQLTRGPASWVQAPHLCGSRHRRLHAGKESAVAGLSSASRRRGLSSRQKMATSKRRHPEALDGRTG